jgi:hypothetical protein
MSTQKNTSNPVTLRYKKQLVIGTSYCGITEINTLNINNLNV